MHGDEPGSGPRLPVLYNLVYCSRATAGVGEAAVETLLKALKFDIMKNINCVKVGVVQSYNATLQEVTVQIAFQQVTSISPASSKELLQPHQRSLQNTESPHRLSWPSCLGNSAKNVAPVSKCRRT